MSRLAFFAMREAAFRPAPSLARALDGGSVRVGTENRAKLRAVRSALAAFAGAADAFELVPVGVPSGVADQPIGWDEIVRGARNRARAAFGSGDCVMAVGIEDGLVRLLDSELEVSARDVAERASRDAGTGSGERIEIGGVFNVGCAWVTDGDRDGYGFSSAFAYPPDCLETAWQEQAPIGELFDALWQGHRGSASEAASESPGGPAEEAPSGRSSGNIGLLTGGRLDRSAYGAQAVICALVRFLHTDLYD